MERYKITLYLTSPEPVDPSSLLDAALEAADHFNGYLSEDLTVDEDETSVEEVD